MGSDAGCRGRRGGCSSSPASWCWHCSRQHQEAAVVTCSDAGCRGRGGGCSSRHASCRWRCRRQHQEAAVVYGQPPWLEGQPRQQQHWRSDCRCHCENTWLLLLLLAGGVGLASRLAAKHSLTSILRSSWYCYVHCCGMGRWSSDSLSTLSHT